MDKLDKIIESLIGKQFSYNEMDCYRFLLKVVKHLGIEFKDEFKNVSYENHYKEMIKGTLKYGNQIDLDKIEKSDVLVFKGFEGLPTHAGIYMGYGRFAHCTEKHGVCISNLDPIKKFLILAIRGKWKDKIN